MVQPHNYGRYYDQIITDTDGFKQFWKTLAAVYKDNQNVIFDTNNEYNTMPGALVVKLNQAAIDGIRAAGATSQIINVEGNQWTGAWTWVNTKGTDGLSNAETMGALTDPQNNLMYQMHQYLDSDGSGTSANCVSSTVGSERLVAATDWLRSNGKVGLIGEFAGGPNAQCQAAIKDMLAYMNANSDVWQGALWWAAGPCKSRTFSIPKPAANSFQGGRTTCTASSPPTARLTRPTCRSCKPLSPALALPALRRPPPLSRLPPLRPAASPLPLRVAAVRLSGASAVVRAGLARLAALPAALARLTGSTTPSACKRLVASLFGIHCFGDALDRRGSKASWHLRALRYISFIHLTDLCHLPNPKNDQTPLPAITLRPSTSLQIAVYLLSLSTLLATNIIQTSIIDPLTQNEKTTYHL